MLAAAVVAMLLAFFRCCAVRMGCAADGRWVVVVVVGVRLPAARWLAGFRCVFLALWLAYLGCHCHVPFLVFCPWLAHLVLASSLHVARQLEALACLRHGRLARQHHCPVLDRRTLDRWAFQMLGRNYPELQQCCAFFFGGSSP